MKKNCLLLAALSLSLSVMAQKEEIIKTGWNFGPLPVVGFDSDLGFQYGLCCDIFNYGNGTNYPQYDYKINVEASTYTKGSSILRTPPATSLSAFSGSTGSCTDRRSRAQPLSRPSWRSKLMRTPSRLSGAICHPSANAA